MMLAFSDQPTLGDVGHRSNATSAFELKVTGQRLVQVLEAVGVRPVDEDKDIRKFPPGVDRIELFGRLGDVARDPVKGRVSAQASNDLEGFRYRKLIVEPIVPG